MTSILPGLDTHFAFDWGSVCAYAWRFGGTIRPSHRTVPFLLAFRRASSDALQGAVTCLTCSILSWPHAALPQGEDRMRNEDSSSYEPFLLACSTFCFVAKVW